MSTFTDRLKTETAAAHTAAEQSPFIAALLGGELSDSAVTSLLAQNYFLYHALENSSAPADFDDPALRRLPALEADLGGRLGPNWRAQIWPSEAAAALAERISAAPPDLYLAHHYLRYLGDLSGGQVISRLVQRHYRIDAAHLSFYTFAEIDKPKLYKDAYHERLNARLDTVERQDAFIAECILGYQLNRTIFDELSLTAA